MLDAYIAYARTGPISRFVYDLEAWKPYLLGDSLHCFPRPVDLIWGMDDELVSFANAEILLASAAQRARHASRRLRPPAAHRLRGTIHASPARNAGAS